MSVAADVVVVVIVAVAASAPKLFFWFVCVLQYTRGRCTLKLLSASLLRCVCVCEGVCMCEWQSSELREFCSVYSPADLHSLVK